MQTGKAESEKALDALLRLYYHRDADVEARLNDALRLGNAHFGTDHGIISQVKGNDYVILFVDSKEPSLEPGKSFSADETYCIHTLQADTPLSFHQASQSHINRHPCYRNFQLETYIGAPIRVNQQVYGTVNFSSPLARHKPFNNYDEAFIATIADWIGEHLEASQSGGDAQ